MEDFPLQWSVDASSVANAPATFAFEASASEREALKRYASVDEVTSFKAEVRVAPIAGGRFRASGTLQARVIQASVVDLEAVWSSIEEDFSQEYWPAGLTGGAEAKTAPFDADPPEPLAGGRIPLGKLLSELLAVSVDPYPRNEGDTFHWSPPDPEPETKPFAGLVRFNPHKSERED